MFLKLARKLGFYLISRNVLIMDRGGSVFDTVAPLVDQAILKIKILRLNYSVDTVGVQYLTRLPESRFQMWAVVSLSLSLWTELS